MYTDLCGCPSHDCIKSSRYKCIHLLRTFFFLPNFLPVCSFTNSRPLASPPLPHESYQQGMVKASLEATLWTMSSCPPWLLLFTIFQQHRCRVWHHDAWVFAMCNCLKNMLASITSETMIPMDQSVNLEWTQVELVLKSHLYSQLKKLLFTPDNSQLIIFLSNLLKMLSLLHPRKIEKFCCMLLV